MDPITIGVAVGTSVVSQLTKKLMEKAANPERVAEAVNWVFSAVSNFFKVRKKEKAKNAPAPQPPEAAPPVAPPAEVEDMEVEAKTIAVQEIAKKLEREIETPIVGGVHLAALDDFAMEQLATEANSLLKQIETYLGNLRFVEEKAAQFGGVIFAPPIVMNTIRIQQQEIAKRVLRLNQCMQNAYGVAAPDLETLVSVTRD